MKIKSLVIFCFLLLTSVFSIAYSKTTVSTDLATAIKLYKSQNYAACYLKINSVIQKDPSNALAYYYKAMTAAQIGKKSEAIENYDKAVSLAGNSNLGIYAEKGKRCLETPDKCSDENNVSAETLFTRTLGGPRFTEKVQSQHEQIRLDNVKRSINSFQDLDSPDFKGFRDFSGMNSTEGMPSDEEIISAVKVLQKAGIWNNFGSGYELSAFNSGFSSSQPDNMYDMFGKNTMNTQLIQSLLTNNMTMDF